VQSSSQNVTTNKPTPNSFTGQMPFLSTNQQSQCQSTEGKMNSYCARFMLTEIFRSGMSRCLLFVDWQAHQNAVFDVDWMPGENQLVTASGDQNIALWDVATESSIAAFHGHTSSIKTVRFLPSHNGLCHCYEVYQ